MKSVRDYTKGDKIFVPDKIKAQYGDSVQGGLATIEKIKTMSDGIYATMDETGKIQWNLTNLVLNQDLYSKKYVGQIAQSYSEDFERDGAQLW